MNITYNDKFSFQSKLTLPEVKLYIFVKKNLYMFIYNINIILIYIYSYVILHNIN